MVITDPIADFLTRIRNAVMVGKKTVSAPYSKIKIAISKVLKEKGYLNSFKVTEKEGKKFIYLSIRYDEEGRPFLEEIKRISKPGKRVYVGYRDLKPLKKGYGFRIISTSRGIMTDEEARKRKLGGEVICEVF